MTDERLAFLIAVGAEAASATGLTDHPAYFVGDAFYASQKINFERLFCKREIGVGAVAVAFVWKGTKGDSSAGRLWDSIVSGEGGNGEATSDNKQAADVPPVSPV